MTLTILGSMNLKAQNTKFITNGKNTLHLKMYSSKKLETIILLHSEITHYRSNNNNP